MRCSSVVLRDWVAGKNGEDKTVLMDTMARIAATVEYRLDDIVETQGYGVSVQGGRNTDKKPKLRENWASVFCGMMDMPDMVQIRGKNPQDEIQRQTEKSPSHDGLLKKLLGCT